MGLFDPIRILVCGSRTWRDYSTIESKLRGLPRGSTVIHGDARGADRMARDAARKLGLIEEPYPADWSGLGRRAGPIRNQLMLDEGRPQFVIAFRARGTSRGTDDTIARARAAGIPVTIIHEPPTFLGRVG